MMPKILTPPDCVRGMELLDKDKFNKTINVPILHVKINLLHSVLITLKKFMLKIDNFKTVQDSERPNKKSIYLNPELVTSFNSLEKDCLKLLRKWEITKKDLTFGTVVVGYDNFTAHDIINAIIPPQIPFSGYTMVGKIIHVNLKEYLLPYKNIIGQILLEKNKFCESVVNKMNSISTPFRTFDIEVLAGSDDLRTLVKENGCKFELDFRTVYWNSRLHEEHCEIISKITRRDVLYDVFCGIGPFAIPVAKKGCKVLANDANKNCCEYLSRNRDINKVKPSLLSIFNKDGADFIKEDIKKDMLQRARDFSKGHPYKIHITMNLPAIAYTFLTHFVGLFGKNELSMFPDELLPTVHLYCFIKSRENLTEKAKQLVEDALNYNIEDAKIHQVRNVAPNKEMLRVTFTLRKEILESDKRKISYCENLNEVKKQRIENADDHIANVVKMDVSEINS